MTTQLPKIARNASKALVSKSVPTRLAAFQLIRELVPVLPGALGPVFGGFVPGIESSLSSSAGAHHASLAASTNTNLRIEVLGFLRSVFASHSTPAAAAQIQPYLDRLAKPIVDCCNDKFYRTAGEGLACASEMVGVIRSKGAEPGKMKPELQKHIKVGLTGSYHLLMEVC